MGKLFNPQDVSSGFNTTNSLNTNFDNIETALDRTLSRYGETPNAMESDLDMNNNDLINAGLVSCDTLEVGGAEIPTLQSFQDLLDGTESALDAKVVEASGYASSASLSASQSVTAQGLAEAAQAAAEAAAASVDLPVIAPGDAGKILAVNGDEDGYDLVTPTAQASAATPSTVMVRDAAGRSQVVDPSADADIATKGYVDSLQPEWIIVITSPTALTMSNVPVEYQSPGLYGVGNTASGIVQTIPIHSTAVSAKAGSTIFGATDDDISVRELSYDGSTGEFTFLEKRYLNFVHDANLGLVGDHLYKLVNS